MNPPFPVRALCAAACLGIALAQAQSLPTVTVTGNPLGAADLITPTDQLSGPKLLLRSQSTLGETLNNTPGVSSTYFGPNASRPVIRGLDGDRIRVLSNGGASVDASGLSFDHAVPMDPIAVDRLEILRGPGALLYGGSAVGGVVNVIDNRIPREPMQGITGRVDASLASASREKAGAVLLEGGSARYGLHVDAFGRNAGDVRAPAALACAQGGVPRVQRRICNSASDTQGGAVGGTAFFERGWLGAAASTYSSHYGTVAEDDVRIGMQSDRYALEGQWRPAGGPFETLRLQASHTDYAHTEFESGVPGTVFRNKGSDLRLEARHRAAGGLQGLLGYQGEQTRFSAAGEEAFAPTSRSTQHAVFVYEELATSWGKLSAGGRLERDTVRSLGGESDRFEPGERRFQPRSMAVGALWQLAPAWQLTGNLAHSERAPKDYELFANGRHVATGAFELGDRGLRKEKSLNVDVGLQWKHGADNARLGAFVNRFGNYISLEAAGTPMGEGEHALPLYAYRAVRARFQGLEASGSWRLLDAAPRSVDLEWRADAVRATNLDTAQPLPRIAPGRVGATLAYAQGAFGARIGVDRSARQNRVPDGEVPVAGYALWNAALTWRQAVGAASVLWYARLDNATDRLAYSASSILTQSAPGRAPLPGRNVRVGLQANF